MFLIIRNQFSGFISESNHIHISQKYNLVWTFLPYLLFTNRASRVITFVKTPLYSFLTTPFVVISVLCTTIFLETMIVYEFIQNPWICTSAHNNHKILPMTSPIVPKAFKCPYKSWLRCVKPRQFVQKTTCLDPSSMFCRCFSNKKKASSQLFGLSVFSIP